MINPDIIGFIGATLTTMSFVPQAIKSIKHKDMGGISFVMYLLLTIGICFWLVYGFMLGSLPMIISNIIALILSAIILFIKIRH